MIARLSAQARTPVEEAATKAINSPKGSGASVWVVHEEQESVVWEGKGSVPEFERCEHSSRSVAGRRPTGQNGLAMAI